MNFLEKVLEFIFLPSCGVCGKLGEGYLCKKCGEVLEKYCLVGKEARLDVEDEIKNADDMENYELEFDNNEINGFENDYAKENSVDKLVKYKNMDKFEKDYGEKNAKKHKSVENKKVKQMHVFKYENLIRKLILQYKFNDKSYLYKTFCEFMVKNKKVFDFIKSYDIIIPVPMHRIKLRKRGYNQSELVARELAKKFNLKIYTDVLIKIKNNKVQSTLTKEERKENIKNVFKVVNTDKIKGMKILILDDIYTTGATVNECVEELMRAKPEEIGVLTLAKD